MRGVLRGLHYQHPGDQAKLIYVCRGRIFDVAVDIRHGSPTFGRWFGMELSDENGLQMFIPEGFAHGFCVLSDEADVIYKCSEIYRPEYEHGIIWNDPDINITWPIKDPILSPKDMKYSRLNSIPPSHLPFYPQQEEEVGR
jgi:dTDP-4-dehydrorhamnose 3,5-epimerase